MRRTSTYTIMLLTLALAQPLWADDQLDCVLDAVQPASSSFRFSDEVPHFELERPATASLSDASTCRDACAHRERLRRIIAPTDPCFSGFISPMTNPVYFENPRTLTEARLLYLRQRVPLSALGGDVDLWALQLRAALTDKLSVLATKSGFITSSSPAIDDGWADINVGLKYNLYANPQAQRLLSAGMTYELPVGSTQAVQGNGDGLFDLFVSGGFAIRQWHVLSTTGLLLPTDRAAESSLWFWSNHLSHRIARSNFHILTEANWYHWMGAGNVPFPLPIEGGDLFNIGALGVAGNDIVTGALGFRYKPSDGLELGVAWEAPLTVRRDVLDNRLSVDCILRY